MSAPRRERSPRARGPWVLVSSAVLVAGLLAFHPAVPNAVGNVGSLLETFLAWLGLVVVALLVLAALRRSAIAVAAVALPAVVWVVVFGASVFSGSGIAGVREQASVLTVLQHNVADDNADPGGTARALAGAGADLVALQELTPQALPVYEAALAPEHPHRLVVGTVGLWSRYPLTDGRPVDIKPKDITADWNRGLRATVRTPAGDIAAYVAHLPSVRIRPQDGFGTAWRDESAAALATALDAEKLERVVLLGDLNGTVHDRGLSPLTSRLTPALDGFGFTWPAAFPLARIDHVMARGATPTGTWVLPATGSDHLPTVARLR
ncbi:vancomycin resistance protein VanJ [Nonomuraea thailandensis]|uniref:Vancomycin resistance protein VanJ n=1 Tax=Nonomuraea thailandensis TaxID=1188745 RepID=A0A9X2GNF0_9ACTN|nr:endonuclease/exonuclease/phosphatase family protein [Nonomuraea thailandensis]MCP2362459.1 vancomycin resistance protein VanJ [Nonomuraea thailandensis]